MSTEEGNEDHPLSYWVTLARMGFENDLHRLFNELGISRAELAKRLGTSPEYVTKVLNGSAGNFQLSTMTKWARALGAIVQIRLIKEGEEVVRVVDYETAKELDDRNVEEKEEASIADFSAHRDRLKASLA
jgi:transcriptional regulator with XRE-family HTH domain